jgi:hypothetical protein
MKHIMIIQSAYPPDRAELSARRLEITRHTSVVALASQRQKPTVHVAIHPEDVHGEARREAFLSTGCEVRFLERPSWRLYHEDWELPEGWKLVSRMDDDDVIARDFCEVLQATFRQQREALLWPTGYVFWRQQIFLLTHRGNQFPTLSTDGNEDPHAEPHWEIPSRWPSRAVSHSPGWIWVRHADAATTTLRRYRQQQVGRIDATRFAVNLRAIHRACEATGVAAADYATHTSPHLQQVRRENSQNRYLSDILTATGSDKAQSHHYGWWYDAWRKHCPRGNVLEVGVLDGASCAAFRAAGYRYAGIDRSLVAGVDVIQCTTPDFAPACAELQRRQQQYDLVVDDGSHRLECQAAAISALWPFVAISGCMWIEDIQSEYNFRKLLRIARQTAPHVQALDMRHLRGRYDDLAIVLSRESLAWSEAAAKREEVRMVHSGT